MNAIELLTAFSGGTATQYEEFFRFSEEARLVGVEIHAVGTGSTTARYSGGEEALNEVNTILRFTTADGSEGISGVDSYFEGEFNGAHLLPLVRAGVEFEHGRPVERNDDDQKEAA